MFLPSDSREAIALTWLLRLPLLGAYELSMLMNEDEDDSRRLLLELSRAGWLDAGTVSSPELEPDRLFSLSAAGLAEMSKATCRQFREPDASLLLHHEDIEEPWARVETTVGINRFLAELVWTAQRTVNLDVVDLRALPRRRAPGAWWPPGVDAYGCLRVGELVAPFFLAWDRAAAPNFHRRRRLSGWSAFRRQAAVDWAEEPPTILVLCPNGETSDQWAKSAESAALRSGSAPLSIAITEIEAVFSADPLESVWRPPLSRIEMPLIDLLAWRHRVPDECRSPAVTELPSSPTHQVSLQSDLASVPADSPRRPSYRQLGSMEKRFLEWLAHHPLLTADDLSVLVHGRRHLTRTLLDRLSSAAFVEGVRRQIEGDATEGVYYFLSSAGLREMARRDGVPMRRLARYGSIAASLSAGRGAGRFQTLVRQFQHTVGVNRFFVRLAAAGRPGAYLVSWLNAEASAHQFTYGERISWIRPDGTGMIHLGGTTFKFHLEFDRGTMRRAQMDRKWSHYAAYYAALDGQIDSQRQPTLLVLVTDPHREVEVCRGIADSLHKFPAAAKRVRVSNLSLFDRDGPLGRIWRTPASSLRQPWPCSLVLGLDR